MILMATWQRGNRREVTDPAALSTQQLPAPGLINPSRDGSGGSVSLLTIELFIYLFETRSALQRYTNGV